MDSGRGSIKGKVTLWGRAARSAEALIFLPRQATPIPGDLSLRGSSPAVRSSDAGQFA